jgi:hypothetical protein
MDPDKMKRRLADMQEDFRRKMADNKARIDAETEQQKKAFEAMLADMAATIHVGAVGADGTGQGAGVAGVGSAAGKAGAEIPVAGGKVEGGDEEKHEDGGQGGKGDERVNREEGGEGVNGGKVGEGRADVGPNEEGGPRKVVRGKESAKPLVLMQNKETVRIKEIAKLVQSSGKGVGGLGGVGGVGGIGGVGGKEKKAIDDSDGFDKEDNARGKKDSKGTPRQGGAGGVGGVGGVVGVGGSGKGAKGVGGISKKEAEKEDKEDSEDGSEDEGSVSKMFTVVPKFNDADAHTGEWVCIYCNKSFPFSFQQKALISTHMRKHHAMVLEDSDVLKRQRKRQNVAERKGRKLLEEAMRRRGEGSESRGCVDRVEYRVCELLGVFAVA